MKPKKKRKLARGITEYSEKIEGTKRNHNWPVSFDIHDGFVGINQFEGELVKDRVLLSPVQFKALRDFVARHT